MCAQFNSCDSCTSLLHLQKRIMSSTTAFILLLCGSCLLVLSAAVPRRYAQPANMDYQRKCRAKHVPLNQHSRYYPCRKLDRRGWHEHDKAAVFIEHLGIKCACACTYNLAKQLYEVRQVSSQWKTRTLLIG